MKTNPLFSLLLSFALILNTTTYEKNFNSTNTEEGNLCAPINMTGAGIDSFIKGIYNNPRYAQDVLPYNFAHLIQLLDHGRKTKQSRSYMQSIMRLFTNKMKACSYIDADAFNEVLIQLPCLLRLHCTPTSEYTFDKCKEKIDSIICTQFLKKFELFKSDPHSFLQNLSSALFYEITAENTDWSRASLEETQKATLVFLEIGLSKLVWNPTSKEVSWHLVKAISENLTLLLEHAAITHTDDLNGLFISLLERYCMFIDLFSTELSKEFYDTVLQDIATIEIPFLELEEQEDFIELKKQRLLRALTHGKVRCYAQNNNIVETALIRQG